MIVPVVVEGQSLRWYGRIPEIADNSIEFVQLEFRFPEDWDNMVIVAQFTQTKTYNCLLVNNRCFLPMELVAGPCEISVFGYLNEEVTRGTTIPLKLNISRSGFVSSAETPIPPTPDLYAQLIDYFSSIAGSGGGGSGSGTINPEDIAAAVEDYLSKNPPEQGEEGGYYTPKVEQPDTNSIQFSFTGSKPDMPTVPAVSIPLPKPETSLELDTTLTQEGKAADAKAVGDAISKHSGGNVELDTTLTQSGKAADAKAVGDAIENLKLSGGGSLNIRDMEENEIFTITGTDSGGSGDTDEPGEDEPSTGAVAINGRIIDIDMRNVQATDEYLTDTSGNGHHMKLSALGSASKDNVWVPNYYDTVANITKYVGVYTENAIDLSGDFTIELFCETKNTSYFRTQAPGWSGKDYAFIIGSLPVKIEMTDQAQGYAPKIDGLDDVFLSGNFYHITVTRQGNDCSLYKNGEFVKTITLTSALPLNYRFYLNAGHGNVQTDGTGTGGNNPTGYKMLRAYTRALSASEIANHYSIELAKG